MKLKLITKRAVTVLLTVVLFTGCLIPHAANNETKHPANSKIFVLTVELIHARRLV